jgi:uncharacterized OsmC-like protein
MTERLFHLKSRGLHQGSSNEIVRLDLEIELDGAWQPVVLSSTTPPFRAVVCAVLMCQHAYLRMNAAERGLTVPDVRGELRMETKDWLVRRTHVHFELVLEGGSATPEDLEFIRERVEGCPVSRNLPDVAQRTTLEVVRNLPPVETDSG